MNCWHILNIPPTGDERAIKRAYAKLLKTTRPDDDAAAYQALRQAFDDALAAAPYIAVSGGEGSAPSTRQLFSGSPSQPASTEAVTKNKIQRQPESPAAAPNTSIYDYAAPLPHPPAPDASREHNGFGTNSPRTPAETEAEAQRQPESPAAAPNTSIYDYAVPLPHPPASDAPREHDGYETNSPFPPAVSPAEEPKDWENEMAQRLRQGGSEALVEYWPEIRRMLDGLPLLESDAVSHRMAAFLRRHHVENPVVWTQWAGYFGWGQDFRGVLSADEAMRLAAYRELVSMSGAYPTGAPQEGFVQTPYVRAFIRLTGSKPSFWRRVAGNLAAAWAWPYLVRETTLQQRESLESMGALPYGTFARWERARSGWIAVLLMFVLSSLGLLGGANLSATSLVMLSGCVIALAAVLLYFVSAVLRFFILAEILPEQKAEALSRFKYSPRGAAVCLIGCPLAAWVLWLFREAVPENWMLAALAFFVCTLSVSFTYHLPYFNGRGPTYCALPALSLAPAAAAAMEWARGSEYQIAAALLAAFLWFNANLYLLFVCPARMERLSGLASRSPLAVRLPVSLLRRMLLIPARIAQLLEQRAYGLLFEIGLGALLLQAVADNMLPVYAVVLLSYPAILLAESIRNAVGRLLLWLLERRAA